MTPEAYRRRIEHAFHVAEWPTSNRFRTIAAQRLERCGVAALGGAHAPSAVATDRSVQAEEPAVELMRHLPAAVTEPAVEF